MSETKVSKRYAKSLLSLSQERNSLEAVKTDLDQFILVCKGNKDFLLMLKNPLIHPDKKLSILTQIFSKNFNPLTIAFLSIIVRKRREFYLEDIANEFIHQYKQLKGIITAIVVTANGVDEKLRKEITNIVHTVSKSEVELEEKVDKDIIGGFILRFGDIQYDSSVARSLNMLRMNFSKNLYESKIIKK